MKKTYMITSIIKMREFPLTYSSTRSLFNEDERLRQTMMTLLALDHIRDSDTSVYLLELSENYDTYSYISNLFPWVKYIPIKEIFPEIWEKLTTHPNKSKCETLLLWSFLEKYKTELLPSDFFIKLSGRYVLDSSFKPEIFSRKNEGKIFFKKYFEFDWKDYWGYELVDLRQQQGNNKLLQICPVVFSWSKKHFDSFLNVFKEIENFLEDPLKQHFDIETLLYFKTRQFESDIILNDWIITGWEGASGRFLRY